MSAVTVEITDHVALLTFSRPERDNAFSVEMLDDFTAALSSIGGDDRVRAVVLAGSGRAFSTG